MDAHLQDQITRLTGPARELALLLSRVSKRIFGNDWECDFEWYARYAIDDGHYTIAGEGRLTPSEVADFKRLREELQGGWVLLEGLGLKRFGALPLGSLRTVSSQEWEAVIGTDEYRLNRYAIVG